MGATGISRRQMLIGAGALGAAAALVQPLTAAADDNGSLLGAWLIDVTTTGQTGVSHAVTTFAPGGALANIDDTGAVGLGSWEKDEGSSFVARFVEFAANNGAPAGTVQINVTGKLHGNHISGTFTGSFTPTGGPAQPFSGSFTGTRLQPD